MAANTATDPGKASSLRQRFELGLLPHLDAAYGLARWLVRDELVAEDIVHDAFLRALQQFHTCPASATKPWLLAVVRQAVRDWMARSAPQPGLAPDEDDTQTTWASDGVTAAPAGPPILKPGRAQVAAAINRMALPLREVLVLAEIEELSPADMAMVLGIPLGTVQARLARSRQQLYAYLRDGDRRPEHERP